MILEFRGLNSAGGDNTALIDAVAIENGPPVPDAGFEAPTLQPRTFRYRPEGSAWSFAGTAGITTQGTGFTVEMPPPPEGVQVAILQQAGSFLVAIPWRPRGPMRVAFLAAQRRWGDSRQDFRVVVDGVTVGTFRPADNTYRLYQTGWFGSPADHRPARALLTRKATW